MRLFVHLADIHGQLADCRRFSYEGMQLTAFEHTVELSVRRTSSLAALPPAIDPVMEVSGEIGTLDTRAIAAVHEKNVVDDSTFAGVLETASLVLPDRGGEVPARGLLLVRDQQTVLTQAADPVLDHRKHLANRLHPMKVQIVRDGWMTPIHPYEDHIGSSSDKRLKTTTIEADSKVDQAGKRLKALLAVEEGMTMKLHPGKLRVLRGKKLRHLLHLPGQPRNVLSRNKRHGEPVPLTPQVRLVDVPQQHAERPRTAVR